MDAVFRYSDNIIKIQDFSRSLEDEEMGNPYNCSFKIKVVSSTFSGVVDNCECDYKEWKKFVKNLNDLLNFNTNEVILQEIGYGGIIRFIGDKFGHIKVSGLLYGEQKTHSLQFEFVADQTVLLEFIKELKCLE